MDRWTELFAPLVGRILLGGFFLWNGIEEILNFSATTTIFLNAKLPYPMTLALIAAGIEVLGGILLVVGLKVRIVAMILILYIALSSALLFSTATSAQTQLYVENMAIIGGLLYVTAYGVGSWRES